MGDVRADLIEAIAADKYCRTLGVSVEWEVAKEGHKKACRYEAAADLDSVEAFVASRDDVRLEHRCPVDHRNNAPGEDWCPCRGGWLPGLGGG